MAASRGVFTALAFLFAPALSASAPAPALAPAPHELLLAAAITQNAIVAVGERGAIYRSPDSGTHWFRVSSGTSATLTAVAFAPNATDGWAAGHDGLILATHDAGVTWEPSYRSASLESSFLDVCAPDAEHVIAIGAYGLFVEKTAPSPTWEIRHVVDEDVHFDRLARGPTGTLYLAGERGTLLRSTDAGISWQRLPSPYDGSFFGILPLGARTLLAHGLRGRLFRSDDDGDTWAAVPTDATGLIATAVRLPSGVLVFAGQARLWLVSRDGGRSVEPWSPGVTMAIAQLLVAPDGTLLAFGENGAVRLSSP